MASYNELNALIDAYINRNGVQAITGQILNGVLKAMVEQLGRGYTIMGAATPTTDPGTPDGPECYFASTPGTYTDFDGLQVAPGELALLCYTPSDGWTKATIYEGFRQVGATIDGNVGTPSVGVSYAGGVLSFDFHNMKGNPGQNGQDGAAAGFGTIGADITGGVGTPGVSVESSGPATAKNLQFHFTNLKGETGVTSVVCTVDNTIGTPSCAVSLVGQELHLDFSGLKGNKGDTGVSADYPITIYNGLDSTATDQALSAYQGKVLNDEISQLDLKVDDLEDGETVLQQQIDAIHPVIIEGNVENAPDEEDITTDENNLLKFANRSATLTNKGYKILRSDKTFAEQVTDINTIYEIRYAFDLDSESVTIPSGCVLSFNGGKLSNGTLEGTSTTIQSPGEKIFDNIEFDGTFDCPMNACWIGAKENDQNFDNSPIVQGWFDGACDYFPVLSFPKGTYYFATPILVSSDKRFKTIDGNTSHFIVEMADEETFLTLTICENFTLKNVEIDNARETEYYALSKNDCLHLNRTHRFVLNGVVIRYFDRAIHLTDVWYGQFVGANSLIGNRIGVYGDAVVSNEINTVLFNNLQVNGCSVDAAKAVYPQEDGESNDDYALRIARCGVDMHCANFAVKYRGMVIEGEDYGLRFNHIAKSANNIGSSVIDVQDCYFEGMTTRAIYFGSGYIYNPDGLSGVYSFRNVAFTITSCSIHDDGIVSVYLNGTNAHIFGCTPGTKVDAEGYGTVSHDSSVIVSSAGSTRISSYTPAIDAKNPDGSTSWYRLPATTRAIRDGFLQSILAPITDFNLTNNIYVGTGSIIRFVPLVSAFSDSPRVVLETAIKPNKMEISDGNLFVNIKSGNGTVRVSCKKHEYTTCTYSFRNDGIDIDTFISKWKAGTDYTGYVNQIFPRRVRTDVANGLVYMEDGNGVESVVGLGKAAIDGGYSMANLGYYILIDTLCFFRNAYSSASFNADFVQNGRDYSEMHDTTGTQSAYDKRNIIVTSTQRDNLTPRFNATIYNKTNKRAEIFNGFSWVALTSPFTRYIYQDNGKSISERAVVPDVPGQTFFNAATGITYRYVLSGDKQSGSWVGDIGMITELTNPNGYDASKNPVAYATELTTGEMVRYNGTLYKWDGTQLVAV